MASCLGLYIEGNLIKYAKSFKGKDVKKLKLLVSSFAKD